MTPRSSPAYHTRYFQSGVKPIQQPPTTTLVSFFRLYKNCAALFLLETIFCYFVHFMEFAYKILIHYGILKEHLVTIKHDSFVGIITRINKYICNLSSIFKIKLKFKK